MITFKEEHMRGEFFSLDARLILIVADLHEYLFRKHNYKIITVTSVLRKDNPNSVHAYFRGIDIRSRDMSQEMIEDVLEVFNNKYTYDIDRPALKTVIHHKVDGGQFHLHVQVKK
jgi:hypothetical protein